MVLFFNFDHNVLNSIKRMAANLIPLRFYIEEKNSIDRNATSKAVSFVGFVEHTCHETLELCQYSKLTVSALSAKKYTGPDSRFSVAWFLKNKSV